MTKALFVALAASAVAVSAVSISAASAQQEQAVPAVEPDGPAAMISQFLSSKRAEQGRKRGSLEKARGASDLAGLVALDKGRGLVAQRLPGMSDTEYLAVSDAFSTDVALLLSYLGIPTQSLSARSAGRRDALDAARGFVSGGFRASDVATLSDAVVLAHPVGVRTENLGDGFDSTVTFEVTQGLSGQTAGREVRLRQPGTADTPTGATIVAASDEPLMLFLSRGYYGYLSAARTGDVPGRLNGSDVPYALMLPPYRSNGGRYEPFVINPAGPIALSDLAS